MKKKKKKIPSPTGPGRWLPLSTLWTSSSSVAMYVRLRCKLVTSDTASDSTDCSVPLEHAVDRILDQVAADYGCLYSSWIVLHCLEDSIRHPGADFLVMPSHAWPPPPPAIVLRACTAFSTAAS